MTVYVYYDARPLVKEIAIYRCEVVKRTKTGFRIKNLDKPGLYEDVLFLPDGTARGWSTLTWENARQPPPAEAGGLQLGR